jgi:mannose-1-phosphate guanylyltransferase
MAKQRISLTLNEELVNRIDRKVDADKYANRSQAIESFIEEQLQSETVGTAVILCGGSNNPPECTIKVNSKPLLHHIITHLDQSGVQTIILAAGQNRKIIEDELGEYDNYQADIEYLEEEQPLGTAGGLRELKNRLSDTFLLVNGDVLCRVDLQDLAKSHREADVLGTMALTTVEDTSPYGVARLKGSRIIGFQQKPAKDQAFSNLINAGVYLLEPDVIGFLPDRETQQKVDVEDLFERLAERRKLKGYVYEGEWHDLGN